MAAQQSEGSSTEWSLPMVATQLHSTLNIISHNEELKSRKLSSLRRDLWSESDTAVLTTLSVPFALLKIHNLAMYSEYSITPLRAEAYVDGGDVSARSSGRIRNRVLTLTAGMCPLARSSGPDQEQIPYVLEQQPLLMWLARSWITSMCVDKILHRVPDV